MSTADRDNDELDRSWLDADRCLKDSACPSRDELVGLADELFVHAVVRGKASPDRQTLQRNLEALSERIDREQGNGWTGLNVFPSRRRILYWSASTAVAASLLLMLTLFRGNQADAALATLARIIEVTRQMSDRTYYITVLKADESSLSDEPSGEATRRGKRRPPTSDDRPPKISLDQSFLYVREENQFVLVRNTGDGGMMITGSNGQTSWAVRPQGPVRICRDLNRFNRDLPGHEHAIRLTNLDDCLEQLRQAYDIEMLSRSDSSRLSDTGQELAVLVARKKPRERGPLRVEIEYEPSSGRLQGLLFFGMPFGSEYIDLKMALIDVKALDADFFDHNRHHAPERPLEYEE